MRFSFYALVAASAIYALEDSNVAQAISIEADTENELADLMLDDAELSGLAQLASALGIDTSSEAKSKDDDTDSDADDGSTNSDDSSSTESDGDDTDDDDSKSDDGSCGGSDTDDTDTDDDDDDKDDDSSDSDDADGDSDGDSDSDGDDDSDDTGSDDDDDELAQTHAKKVVGHADLAQLNTAVASASESNSGSDSESNSESESMSSGEDIDFAQVGADELAQINAQLEALEAENLDYFASYMSQIGIEDSELFLAQLGSELTSEQMQMLATNPDVYYELAQMFASPAEEETSGEDLLAQTLSAAQDGDMDKLTSLLTQLDTSELNQLTEMLKGVNEGLSLGQTESLDLGDDAYENLF